MKYFFGISSLVFIITVQIDANDKCEQISPCSCKFDNGTGYDLAELNKSFDNNKYIATPSINNIQYYFHPCSDIIEPTDKLNYSIIQVNESNKDVTRYEFLGSAADAKFQVKSSSEVYIIYPTKNHNETTSTIIKLACTNIAENHLFSTEPSTTGDYSLLLFSNHACLKTIKTDNDTGMSVGSILLATLFIIVFGYLSIGMSLKYFIIGARGSEVIPNINFWRNLPSLVKDGTLFLLNGCRPTHEMSQNQDSYISI